MPKFIKLNIKVINSDVEPEPWHVNIKLIQLFRSTDVCNIIFIDNRCYDVQETPEEILKLIAEVED